MSRATDITYLVEGKIKKAYHTAMRKHHDKMSGKIHKEKGKLDRKGAKHWQLGDYHSNKAAENE